MGGEENTNSTCSRLMLPLKNNKHIMKHIVWLNGRGACMKRSLNRDPDPATAYAGIFPSQCDRTTLHSLQRI